MCNCLVLNSRHRAGANSLGNRARERASQPQVQARYSTGIDIHCDAYCRPSAVGVCGGSKSTLAIIFKKCRTPLGNLSSVAIFHHFPYRSFPVRPSVYPALAIRLLHPGLWALVMMIVKPGSFAKINITNLFRAERNTPLLLLGGEFDWI